MLFAISKCFTTKTKKLWFTLDVLLTAKVPYHSLLLKHFID